MAGARARRHPGPTPGVIPTLDLLTVLAHRRTLRDLQAQVRVAAAALAEAEERVLTLYRAGARPETDRYTVAIHSEPGAICPKWKQEHLTHMAEVHGASPVTVEQEVRSRYQPATSHELIIEEHT